MANAKHLPGTTQERRLWERWTWAWHALYLGGLIWIGWCLWIPDVLPEVGTRLRVTVGLAALSLWYVGMAVRRPLGRRSPLAMVLYLAVAVGVWAVLYRVHELLMVVAWMLAAQAFLLLPAAWAVSAALAVTGLAWVSAGRPLGLEPISWLLSLAVAGLVMGWQRAMVRRSEERQALVEELAEARDDLAAAERQAGVLEERQRLAREIHDTVAQELSSIVLHLEAADAVLEGGGATARQHLDQARKTARQGLAEARRLVHALRPELLEGHTLPEALERLAERWTTESGVPANVCVPGDGPALPREVEVTVLRAAQEALANVRKHASASEVSLTFSVIGDLVVLDVQDNGRGFATGAIGRRNGETGGYGLVGMRERAEQLGGRLVVESAPGEGTTVVLELPTP